MWRILLLLVVVVTSSRCAQESDILLAEDFEGAISKPFDEHDILRFQDNCILGSFNNQRITMRFENLKKHSEVSVQLDLFIHDSWDGNSTGVNGPDIWILEVGKNKGYFDEFRTSFSNSSCNTAICLLQSFPEVFPYPNDPKTAVSATLPGLCHFGNRNDGTSLYKIDYTFKHKDSRLYISMFDSLVQTNTDTQKCDESWSIDNFFISIQ